MKKILLLVILPAIVLFACETPEDIFDTIDHTLPAVVFSPDTLVTTAGNTIKVKAEISDESGIQRIEFSYGNWRVNEIINLKEAGNPKTYTFEKDIAVPTDVLKQWEENQYYNDGSSLKIMQHYHKLTLTTWDMNRNMRKGWVWVRVE